MVEVISNRVGFGRLGVGGDLGWSDMISGGRVRLPPKIPYAEALSAHAPSEVAIRVDAPCFVRGAMNVSADPRDTSAVFRAGDRVLGELRRPCGVTSEMYLPAGEHVLAVSQTRMEMGGHAGLHTVWLLRPTVGRLALVTNLCYPADQAHHYDRLRASASACGVPLVDRGAGTCYGGHYVEKVLNLIPHIRSLPNHYTHVLYMDGTDTLLIGNEEQLLDRFASYADSYPVIVGMEACCWPEHSPEWAELQRDMVARYETDAEAVSGVGDQYERSVNARGEPVLSYVNAGMFAGERGAVLRHLERLRDFQDERRRGGGPDWLKRYPNFSCDQFLWQAWLASHADDGTVKLDVRAELFLNMSCQHLDVGTPHLRVDADGLETRHGTRPLCLHFSGWGVPHLEAWKNWLLGA